MNEVKKPSKTALWIGRNIFMLIALAILAISAITYFSNIPAKASELRNQEAMIEELQAMQSAEQLDVASVANETLAGANGMSVERQQRDANAGQAIVAQATNWDSDNSYIEARDGLIEQFGFSNEDPFLTVFMPGPDQGAYRVAPSGEVYFAYPGLNSRLSDFQWTLTNVDGQNWNYFAVATISVTHPNAGVASNAIAVTFSVDADGNVVDIMAYPSIDAQTFS